VEDQRFPDEIAVRRRCKGRTEERKLHDKGRRKGDDREKGMKMGGEEGM